MGGLYGLRRTLCYEILNRDIKQSLRPLDELKLDEGWLEDVSRCLLGYFSFSRQPKLTHLERYKHAHRILCTRISEWLCSVSVDAAQKELYVETAVALSVGALALYRSRNRTEFKVLANHLKLGVHKARGKKPYTYFYNPRRLVFVFLSLSEHVEVAEEELTEARKVVKRKASYYELTPLELEEIARQLIQSVSKFEIHKYGTGNQVVNTLLKWNEDLFRKNRRLKFFPKGMKMSHISRRYLGAQKTHRDFAKDFLRGSSD